MGNTPPKIRQISDEEIFKKNKPQYLLKFVIGFCFTIFFVYDFISLLSQDYSCVGVIEVKGIYKFIREILMFIFSIYWCFKYGKILIKRKLNANKLNIKTKKIVIILISICALLILIPTSLYFTLNIINFSSVEKKANDNDILSSNISIEQKTNIENTITEDNIKKDNYFDGENAPCPEPRCGGIEVENISAIASHTLKKQQGNSYQVDNLLDNDETTVWATHFTGEEETLTFFMHANKLYKLSLINGYNKNRTLFENNSRAKDVRVYINGVLDNRYTLSGMEERFPEYITLSKEYNDVREVKIVISSVYEGDKWNDLCISDVCFFTKE